MAPRARPAHLDVLEVPKTGEGLRVLTTLSPSDGRAYERAVAGVVPLVERSLDRHVHANRLEGRGVFEEIGAARARWRNDLGSLLTPGVHVVTADVRDCYPSVGPDAVGLALRTLGAERAVVERVLSVLARVRAAGILGLPVGPWPSAVLANAALSVPDAAARGAGATITRWVDDVVICARDHPAAIRAFDAWVEALRSIGLEPNEAKTRYLGERDEAAQVLLGATASGAMGSSRGMMRAP